MYRYAEAFRCSRRNFLCFEESCRVLTQRPVRVDEKCLWREFSVFPYDGINTPDTVSQQYPELTKLCLRYFAQDKNTDSFVLLLFLHQNKLIWINFLAYGSR